MQEEHYTHERKTMEKVILAVDDSASVRKFVLLSLKSKGFRVLSAQDGMEALEILAGEPVSLVITDLNMPNLDGFGLIKSIRENPTTLDLPIIVLSSLSDHDDVKRGMDLGANSYLVKPFNALRLQYEISKYI